MSKRRIRVACVLVAYTASLWLHPQAGAATPSPGAEAAALDAAWARPREQSQSGVYGAAVAEAWHLLHDVYPLEDRIEFAGRPRLTLARLMPQIFLGDPWRDRWDGTRQRVHFTNRHGALLTGDLWGPPDGTASCRPEARCPGVVVVEGGSGASARQYWWAAQALARAGYVVLTFDVQGQGESETFGHDSSGRIACTAPSGGPDDPPVLRESGPCGGIPSEQAANFTWAAMEAYDWFTSDANPWAGRLDSSRIGAAGHSWGATAVSYLQSVRPVRAVVAWDWLSMCPHDPDDHAETCPDPPAEWFRALAPALDLQGDYLYWPWPRLPPPPPGERLAAFGHWVHSGVDAATLVIRGGTHFDFESAPVGLPASRDGQALAAFLTVAFMDRYVRDDPSGTQRLLARRWTVDRYDPMGRPASVEVAADSALSEVVDSAVSLDGSTCRNWRTRCGLP